ncbi:MAG: hypothetical protein C0469_00325 [Cyanobacteria bacterium DS2.3.42]|nr:hypothetical protein [Cyanobacteria bacterium DS2.3.42]
MHLRFQLDDFGFLDQMSSSLFSTRIILESIIKFSAFIAEPGSPFVCWKMPGVQLNLPGEILLPAIICQ